MITHFSCSRCSVAFSYSFFPFPISVYKSFFNLSYSNTYLFNLIFSVLSIYNCSLLVGKISEEEFETLNTDGLDEYMKDLRENHPRFRDRFSEQTWIRQGKIADPIMRKIRDRYKALTSIIQSNLFSIFFEKDVL